MYATKKAQGAFGKQKTSGTMGAYGDDIYASKRPTENFNDNPKPASDPFGWDNNKKENRNTMPARDLSKDDPWGEVKESELTAKREVSEMKSGFDAESQPKSFFGGEKKEEDPFAFGEEAKAEKKDEFAFDDFDSKPTKGLEEVFEEKLNFDPFETPAAAPKLEEVVFDTPAAPFEETIQEAPFAQPDPFASAPLPTPTAPAFAADPFATATPAPVQVPEVVSPPVTAPVQAPTQPEELVDKEKKLVNLGSLGAPPKPADNFGFPATSNQFGGFEKQDFAFESAPKKEDWLEF